MARANRNKKDAGRLAAVTLDEASLGSSNDDVEHERRAAIYDLLQENVFKPAGLIVCNSVSAATGSFSIFVRPTIRR